MKENNKINLTPDQIIETEIIDMNHKGQGIAKKDGFVIFVDNAVTGDICKIQITLIKKKYGVGKVIEVLEKSTIRVKPNCKYFHSCGGCQIMNIDYDEQLKIKKHRVVNELKKVSNIENIIVHDTIGMENPFRYRNKGSFPVAKSNGEIAIGAYEIGSHKMVDLDSCIIQHETVDEILKTFKIIMNLFKLKPYDEIKDRGLIKHLMIRSNKQNEIMIIIVTAHEKLPYKYEIADKLVKEIPNIKSIIQNVNIKQTNVILGNKNNVIYGDEIIKDTIFDLEFSISPHSFFQVNHTQTEVLYSKTLEYAHLTGKEIVFDIYCGIGTISLLLAKKAKEVYGIEIVKQAIINAKENADKNNIDNAHFFTGKAENIFPELYKKGITADVIVVDPPRKGCEKEVLNTIISMNPKRVVYVSCNPATLARDLKILEDGDYDIKKIQPVDMFPHSMHVECVCLIEKK